MVKLVWNNAQRVNHQNFAKKTHPCAKKNLVPRAVLMKSGLVSINTARQNISKTAVLVNTARQVNVAHSKTTVNAARPMSYLSKIAHSTVKRPIHKNTAFKNSNINQRVNTVRGKKNIARPKAVVNAVKGNNFNAVKASACWIQVSDGLGPQKKLIFLSNVQGNPQMDLQNQGVIDSGCSRNMTGNMSYLTDYGLGYKNPERLKKAITSQSKMYDGERLKSRKLKIDSLDFEETLEDAEESRLKMRNKMIQLDYGKLNALYETFVPRQEISVEQTYFLTPTSTITSDSNKETSELPTPKMPNKNSRVKRSLFTSPVAAKSRTLEATAVVAKSKFSIDKTLTATNKVIQLVLWIVDSGCSKHMTGNLKLLRKFIDKFTRKVRFENDHFAAITGYGDYVQGNLTICHVYYVEGLGHNLFLVGQFCNGDLEVAFRSNTCYVWNLEGDDLLTGSREFNLYTISISKLAASYPVCLMSKATSTKSWLWHRRLSHLNFGTINQLTSKDLVDGLPKFKYNKEHLCSACEQGKSKKATFPSKLIPSTNSKLELLHMDLCGPMRNRSVVHTRYNNTPYELIRGRKPNVQYFHVFGSLCYLTNDRDDLGKMKSKADICIFIGYSESSRGFRIYNHRTRKIMETIHVIFDELTAMASECNNSRPGFNCSNFQDSSADSQSVSLREDLDNLFGPLYEEYYATRSPEVSDNFTANTLESMTLLHHFSNDNTDEQIKEDVAEPNGNDFQNPFHTPVLEEAKLSSTYQDPSNMHEFYQKHRSTDMWTKNHPIEQVISDLSKHVKTRSRLHIDAEMCMYALTMITTELKNIKEAMLDYSWIDSMQEELNQFKCFDGNLSNILLEET
ncbi:retrovirus-related pol polyprotein from transposon TNT 1-94 [Tanacetum coccineum]